MSEQKPEGVPLSSFAVMTAFNMPEPSPDTQPPPSNIPLLPPTRVITTPPAQETQALSSPTPRPSTAARICSLIFDNSISVPVLVDGFTANEDWVHLLLSAGQNKLSVAHMAMLKLDMHDGNGELEVAFLNGLDFEFHPTDAPAIRVLSFARVSDSIREASQTIRHAKGRTTKIRRKINSQREPVSG